jgi:hypothetical protein
LGVGQDLFGGDAVEVARPLADIGVAHVAGRADLALVDDARHAGGQRGEAVGRGAQLAGIAPPLDRDLDDRRQGADRIRDRAGRLGRRRADDRDGGDGGPAAVADRATPDRPGRGRALARGLVEDLGFVAVLQSVQRIQRGGDARLQRRPGRLRRARRGQDMQRAILGEARGDGAGGGRGGDADQRGQVVQHRGQLGAGADLFDRPLAGAQQAQLGQIGRDGGRMVGQGSRRYMAICERRAKHGRTWR